jgi:hypothetical protein
VPNTIIEMQHNFSNKSNNNLKTYVGLIKRVQS